MVKPKVSVICPVFNAEKYLSACLDSLLSQSLKEIEVICINDHSSDNSLEILQKYAIQDSRLIVIDGPHKGAAACRNLGIALAKADYIQFTDADDLLEPDMLEGLYKAAINYRSDVTICKSYDLIKNRLTLKHFALKTYLIKPQGVSAKTLGDNIFRITNPSAWNKLFRKNFLFENKILFQNLTSCNDIAFTWLSLAFAERISYSNCGGYIYRRYGHNVISKTRGNYSNNIIEAAKLIRDTLINKGLFDTFKVSYYSALPNCLKFELKHCGAKQATNLIEKIKEFLPEEEFIKFAKHDRIILNVFGVKIKLNRLKTQKFLQRIFSLNQQGKKINIHFLGLKLKFSTSFADFRQFINHPVRPNSVLIVEINKFHGELLPGVHDYFTQLGYQTDFLIDDGLLEEKALAVLSQAPNAFIFDKRFALKPKFHQKLRAYSFVFFNTHYDYKNKKTVFESLKLSPDLKTLAICHDLRHLTADMKSSGERFFALAKFLPLPLLNTHKFGQIQPSECKHSTVNFVVIGNIESQRKNHSLLVKSVENLISKGIKDFKISVVGKGNLNEILNDKVRAYFDVKGRLDYPSMYNVAAQADFILALLDPEIPSHERYISTATSGNFQLIYGFCKPCLIHKKFAVAHGLNETNSLIYCDNSDLSNLMREAITLSDENYQKMKENLKLYADELYQISLSNLKSVVQDQSTSHLS